MTIKLTEELIHEQANDRSYERGREYYLAGAIYSPAWQTTPGGIALTSMCSGSGGHYSLRVELDENGIISTSCTCPYDGDGDCKHIFALLLKYRNYSGIASLSSYKNRQFILVEKRLRHEKTL
jgi:uncharacterized Zn finger protein